MIGTAPARIGPGAAAAEPADVGDPCSAWSWDAGVSVVRDRVRDSFVHAAAAQGSVLEQHFSIAGHRLALRSPSARMMRALTRTFAHLERPPDAAPELVVHLWDSDSLGTTPPPAPEAGAESAPGAFFYSSDRGIRIGYELGTSGDPRVLAVYPHAPTPTLSVLDGTRREAWYWVADATRIPYWEQATPIKYLLDWWLRDCGIHQLHAGAVGTDEGGVLLVGKSGSGKSTSTLATLNSDLRYAGDDYVGVSIDQQPWVHCLYGSGKLMPDHVRRLPFLVPALANRAALAAEKAVVYVHEHWPQSLSTGFPLRAVLVPRVTPGLEESRVHPISRAAGLQALAPSTVFQMHTRGRDSLERMARLVQQVPCFQLQLGSDMASIPMAITRLVQQLQAGE